MWVEESRNPKSKKLRHEDLNFNRIAVFPPPICKDWGKVEHHILKERLATERAQELTSQTPLIFYWVEHALSKDNRKELPFMSYYLNFFLIKFQELVEF